jgi:CBS domain-containing protein
LAITLGLFCFGSFSLTPLVEYITKTYDIQPSEIKQMRLSSQFVVQTKDGTIRIPISEIEDRILPSCRTCTDFTNELADISVGGAYPLGDWSTVIIRTKAGEDFFYNAVESGVINTWAIEQEPNVFERTARAAILKRNAALKQAEKMEATYGVLPIRMLRETQELAHIKVEEIMTREVQTIPQGTAVNKLLNLMAKQHHVGYPILDGNGDLAGIVTIEDAAQVDKEKRSTTTVDEIARRKPATAYPGETALDAFKKMTEYETGRVLVLDRADPKKLLGIITKTDLIHTLMKRNIE